MNRFIIIMTLSFSLVFMTGCIDPKSFTKQDSQIKQTNNNPKNEAGTGTEAGTEAVANKTFESNTRIKISSIGLTLTVPQGWRGSMSDEVFLMETDNIGSIVITSDNSNEEESRQIMSNTIDIGDGIFLQPNTQVNKEDNILWAEYEVFGAAQPTVGYIIKVMGSNDNGYLIVAIAPKNQLVALESAIETTVDSMSYFQPTTTTPPISANTQTNNSNHYWAKELAGLSLTTAYGSPSYRSRITIVLCSDGNFSRSKETIGFITGYKKRDGQWSTSGDKNSGILQLNYNDGEVDNYELSMEDEMLFLNGNNYLKEGASC